MFKKLKSWALGSINYNMKIMTAKGSFTIPIVHNVGRAHLDQHEPHIYEVLKRLYTPETLLIDVGVNIGQTLVKFASIAGVEGRYIGFEPNIKAASYVDEIIMRNGLQNARVVPVGLGSHSRLAKLLMATAGSTDPAASINQEIRDPEFYGAGKMVVVFNGDQALDELGVTAGRVILKIDVEGAELEVLSGLEKAINKLRPFIILEILPPANFSSGVNDYRLRQAEKLKTLMSDRGYIEHSVGERGDLVTGVSPTHDYLFVPKEKLGEMCIDD